MLLALSFLIFLYLDRLSFRGLDFFIISKCLRWLRSDSVLDQYLWWLLVQPLMGSQQRIIQVKASMKNQLEEGQLVC